MNLAKFSCMTFLIILTACSATHSDDSDLSSQPPRMVYSTSLKDFVREDDPNLKALTGSSSATTNVSAPAFGAGAFKDALNTVPSCTDTEKYNEDLKKVLADISEENSSLRKQVLRLSAENKSLKENAK